MTMIMTAPDAATGRVLETAACELHRGNLAPAARLHAPVKYPTA